MLKPHRRGRFTRLLHVSVVIVAAFAQSGLDAADAWAGWALVEKGGSTTLLSAGTMKTGFPGGSLILTAGTGQLIVLADNHKMYSQGTVKEYCSAINAMMDEMVKGMPPEQQEAIASMMSGEPPAVTISEGSDGGKLLDRDTMKYDVMVNGALYQEVWLPRSPALQKELGTLPAMLGELTACIQSPQMGNLPEMSPAYLGLMKNGLPLKIVGHQEDQTMTALEVTSIEEKEIPATAFKAPEGYKKVSFAETLRVQMGAMPGK